MNGIDVLIAEKVMGWRKESMAALSELMPSYDVWVKSETEYDNVENFRPSERIQDAFLVVDKFDYFKLEKEDEEYFYAETLGDIFGVSWEPTAPLAICYAALKALKIEIPDLLEGK